MRVPRCRGGVFAGSGGTRSVLRSVGRRFYVGKCPQGQADRGSPADEPRGAFLAECGEGSRSPPRPAASRWGILWCCRTDSPRRTPEAGCPTTLGPPPARSRYVVPRTVVANGVSLLARSAGSTASSSAICSRTRSPPAGRSTVLRRCVPSRQSAPVASRTTASGVPGSAVGIAGAAHPGVANPHVQLTAAPIRAS